MATIADQAFINERVVIDGNEYRGCTFTDCDMVFRGEHPFAMDSCVLQEPKWHLEGPAANTMKFLMAAYHGMGEAGVKLVEATFNNIRLNKLS